jgi:hypothetical protein
MGHSKPPPPAPKGPLRKSPLSLCLVAILMHVSGSVTSAASTLTNSYEDRQTMTSQKCTGIWGNLSKLHPGRREGHRMCVAAASYSEASNDAPRTSESEPESAPAWVPESAPESVRRCQSRRRCGRRSRCRSRRRSRRKSRCQSRRRCGCRSRRGAGGGAGVGESQDRKRRHLRNDLPGACSEAVNDIEQPARRRTGTGQRSTSRRTPSRSCGTAFTKTGLPLLLVPAHGPACAAASVPARAEASKPVWDPVWAEALAHAWGPALAPVWTVTSAQARAPVWALAWAAA